MVALTQGKKAQRYAGGGLRVLGVAANAVCFAGGLAIAQAGMARPARAGTGVDTAARAAEAAGYRAVGVFVRDARGGSSDGGVTAEIKEGVFLFVNSAGADAVLPTDVGGPCFARDDQTVSRTNPNNTLTPAGIVQEVTAEGVWVDVSLTISGLLAS